MRRQRFMDRSSVGEGRGCAEGSTPVLSHPRPFPAAVGSRFPARLGSVVVGVLAVIVSVATASPRMPALPPASPSHAVQTEAVQAGPVPRTAEELAELAANVRAGVTAEGLARQVAAIVAHDRLSGSPGENAAIDHIVSTLRGDGVPVEVYEFPAYISDPLSARVEIVGTDLAPESNTVAFSASVSGLEAPVVAVDSRLPDFYTATGEDLGLDIRGTEPAGLELAAVRDLRGAIALIDGTPGPDSAWKLERLGAVGAIYVNPEEKLNELTVGTIWGAPSARSAGRIPRLAVTQVQHSAGEAIRELLGSGEVRARLTTELRAGWRPLRLAVAYVRSPRQDAPFAVFGGHIDAWFFGGTDEGASNAAMVEIARAFHRHSDRLRRDLVVAWWPGHSNGRYAGSTWFADHLFADLTARGVAYLNVDGIGQIDASRFSAAATPALASLAQSVAAERVGVELRTRRPGRNSDQSFNGIGLPLLQFSHSRSGEVGGYWWWHTADDTLDKVDPEILELDAHLYVDALTRILAAPILSVDLVAEIEGLGELIAEVQQRAGERFDLGEARLRQVALLDVAAQIMSLLPAQGEAGAEVDVELVRILRPLYRVTFTLSGPYHPDPAVGVGLLPGLAPVDVLSEATVGSHAYNVALTSLVRERNRLVEALDQAMSWAEILRDRLMMR